MAIPSWLDETKSFPERVGSLYEPDGLMAKQLANFRPRAAQKAFAEAVAQAIESRETVIAEAGTGTGKTFAYLIPAIVAGVQTVVSTAGKSLQDQLFSKDLPTIRKMLGLPFSVAILKGRANYVCPYHLELAKSQTLPERNSYIKLRRIEKFAATSQTGDKAELHDVPEDDPLWPMVTSTRENCLGSEKCPHWDDCFVRRARERALDANVVVVNHHLFLSSLAIKQQSNGTVDGLLPTPGLTVIDEAHQLPQIASDFFGQTFSTNQLKKFSDEVTILGTRDSLNGIAKWADMRTALQKAIREFRLACHELGLVDGTRVSLGKVENLDNLYEPMVALWQACAPYHQTLRANSGRDPDLDTLGNWFYEIMDQLERWCDTLKHEYCRARGIPEDQLPTKSVFVLDDPLAATNEEGPFETTSSDAVAQEQDTPEQTQAPSLETDAKPSTRRQVQWIDVTAHDVRFVRTPLSFAEDFRRMRDEIGGTWVFTSATLSNHGNFTHFRHELGIDEAQEHSWESPFHYYDQGCLYVPPIPAPNVNRDQHTRNVIDAVWPLICAAQGRTFVLCTSLKAVVDAANQLEGLIVANGSPYKLLVQGEGPKGALIDAFREHGNAILVGSMSFWEGVDVRGEALSLVVIDKLPFSPPDDPVGEARCQLIRSQGGEPFRDYVLPEAIIALKQGTGRLIRSETDRGMVVICDSRLVENKYYGKTILRNLPDFVKTRQPARALDFFLHPDHFQASLYQH